MDVNEVVETPARAPASEPNFDAVNQLVACIDEDPSLHRWSLVFDIWQQSQASASSKSISDETGQIFLQQGFEAWVAYALLKYPTLLKKDCLEKRKRTSLLDSLQRTSIDSRKCIATRVLDKLGSRPSFLNPPEIVTKCLIELGKRSELDPLEMAHLAKRRRTDDINDRDNPSIDFGLNHSVDPSTSSQALTSIPAPHQDTNAHYPTPNLSSRSPNPQTNCDASWDGRIVDSSPADCPPLTSHELYLQTAQYPSLEAVRLLFPEHIANVIEIGPHPTQEGSYASSLTMSFPSQTFNGQCQMAFDISESKLPYLAHRWFNTSVECDWRGARHLCIENERVKIIPVPTLFLEGIRKQMAQAEFGPEVFEAIEATSIFQNEMKMGLPTTSTVMLKIANLPDTKAQVLITLDEVKGTQIKKKLWNQ